MLEYRFSKSRLPRGWSHPLRRSLLDAALEHAGITSVRRVDFHHLGASIHADDAGGESGILARWEGVDPTVWSAYVPPTRVALTVYPVPSDERHSAAEVLVCEGLPKLCSWLGRAERATETWRLAHHRYTLVFANGLLEERESWGPGLDRAS